MNFLSKRTNITPLLMKTALFVVIGVFTFASNYLLAAWQSAPVDPPNQNRPFPLNVGSDDQIKGAGLSLLSLIVNGPVQIQDGTEGANKVLVSNSAGVGSWKATSTLGATGGGGGGSENLSISVVTSNDPNNESCTATCPADTVLIGGGCDAVPEAPLQVDARGPTANSWQCETSPNISFGGYSGGLTCSALCAEGNTAAGGGDAPPTCADGEIMTYTSGSWSCAPPPTSSSGVTQLDSGNGITLSPDPITASGTAAADLNYLQRRITSACPGGEAVRGINADGSIQCEPIVGGGGGCTYSGATYSTGDKCSSGRHYSTCSEWTGTYFYEYSKYIILTCQSDGTWSSVNSCTSQPGC